MANTRKVVPNDRSYAALLAAVARLFSEARRASARSVNAVMTATYWEVGRRLVEQEQRGKARAEYGEALIKKLAADLTARFGKGFSRTNLQQMREFFLAWPICQTVSGKLPEATNIVDEKQKGQTLSDQSFEAIKLVNKKRKRQTLSGKLAAHDFPLPWSHYVRLLSVKNTAARRFYEAESLRGGWSVRQLDRQISSQFYERMALSRKKAVILKNTHVKDTDQLTPEEEIKDPLVLEFLGLKDEYSESALEETLIQHLEQFLLELGNDFTFVGRQRRLRVGDDWFRIDLLFYHRRLRCLIIIDLKIGRFSHADAGQMNLYLNYAHENWMLPGENPPVGIILCSEKDDAVAHYALGNLRNKVLASEYKLALPDEKRLAKEIEKTRKALAKRRVPLLPSEI
jgi:predicted nuclease of restriction endonuclease-like (RecB) superfamily